MHASIGGLVLGFTTTNLPVESISLHISRKEAQIRATCAPPPDEHAITHEGEPLEPLGPRCTAILASVCKLVG